MTLLVPHAGGEVPIPGLSGTRGIHALGGMMIAWSHAVPRPHLTEEWNGTLSGDTLSKYLDEAETLLWSTDSLFDDVGPRQQWVRDRIAAKIGTSPRRVPLAARRTGAGAVEYAGAAALFDPEGAVGDLTILTGAIVRRVVQRAGVASSVVAVHAGAGEFTASGAIVVIGAGAIGTPQLLVASGLRHPALGRFVTDHLNIVSMVPLSGEAPIANESEPALALYLPVADDRPFHTAVIDLPSVAHTGVSMGDDALSTTNIGTFIGTEPVYENTVEFDEVNVDAFGLPRPRAHIELTNDDHARVSQALVDQYQIARAIGDTKDGSTSFLRPYGSALHLMGTHRMGSDERTSVLDEGGKVRGTANIWAVGNGVIPTRNSVNPTLTSIALALHTADRMIDDGTLR
ncbi:hypothetical protein ASD65_11120 [Microbacterium sp. Root61]|nr:hypothetical protein ASD65_11120 [Microbacterium sp. Root61]